jgi:hypothetical protein
MLKPLVLGLLAAHAAATRYVMYIDEYVIISYQKGPFPN